MDVSSDLLRRLVSHVTGFKECDERFERNFKVAVSFLNEGLSSPPVRDHNVISNKIQRKLAHENRLEDATHFSGLIKKLSKSDVLKNKSAMLTLFYALKDNASCKLGSGLGNVMSGHHDEETFHMPKLHYSSESHGASSRNVSEKEAKSSRVWHLAERYKSAATAQPNSPFAELQQLNIKSGVRPSEKLPLKQSLHKHPMKADAMVEVTERDLIREILYIFQGLEGKIIKMDAGKDGYRIDSKVRLSSIQKDHVLKLTEVGWLYIQIKRFCDWGGRKGVSEKTSDRVVSGLVHQSLVLSLKDHLNEYCRLIAILETQIQEGGDTPLGEASGGLTLKKLSLWTWDPRFRLRTLALLADSARQEHGGACISKLYKHLHHGDPSHQKVVSQILSKASYPVYMILTEWLLDGKLEDPHYEFFIASDPLVLDDRLWQDKYSIRWTMLPSFISHSQAKKILASGKSLNFLRNVCHIRAPIAGRDLIKRTLQQTTVESLFTQDDSEKLDDLISLTFRETSKHVLEEILTRHKFLTHLRALRRYLLLGQGDFIHYLMEILSPELGKPATNLYPHNLSSYLETAIAASNAQYEEPDILKRLDVRLLEVSVSDSGWDVFSLDYHADGPIGTVFTEDCMRQYLMLFHALWKDKRMEIMLSNIWKEQAATTKLCRDLPELKVVLHGVQLLTTEMVHLVHQMEYYMTFEVMECSWHGLMTKLKSAQSLDDVIAAHNEFLKRIVAGTLLDNNSKDIRIHLRTLYILIENTECLQEKLSAAVVAEVNARKTFEADIKARTDAGDFGTSAELQEAEKKRRKIFTSKVVTNFSSDLRISVQSYQDNVRSFLFKLTQHDDENLRLLSSRLDFNLYYHQRDHRLNQRLTYHHKRKSMGASFSH